MVTSAVISINPLLPSPGTPITNSNGVMNPIWYNYQYQLTKSLIIVAPSAGGTGVDNGNNTITVQGSIRFQNGNPITFISQGSTFLTLPTSGTLISATDSVTFNTSGTTTVTLPTSGTLATTDQIRKTWDQL